MSDNQRTMEFLGKPIAPEQDTTGYDDNSFILDRDWAKTAFLLSDDNFEEPSDIRNRYWSSASVKFTDTRMGCNIGVNAKPQFTRYSDIRVKGRLEGRNNVSTASSTGNYGMGRYYSEAIDDPGQVIYMRFGVPQFNSLFNFFSRAYDYKQITLARTGRFPSVTYDVGKVLGTVVITRAVPIIAVMVAGSKVVDFFFSRPTSKFYTLKPTMHLYWSTVNNLVNTLAINRGIFPKILFEDAAQRPGQPFKLDEEYLDKLALLLPDVFGSARMFDMYALANRAQILANKLFQSEYDLLNEGTPTDFLGYVKKELTTDGSHPTYISNSDGEVSLKSWIDKCLSLKTYFTDENGEEKGNRLEPNPKVDPVTGADRTEKSWMAKFIENTDAEFRQGSQYATFRVNHTGTISESFGNSVVESDMSQKLNSISSSVREARFSFADGNFSNDMISNTVKGVLGGVTDLIMGGTDGVTVGLASLVPGLGGSGFIDIPKHWQSSNATLPKSSYSMDLISPYGNPISQVQNIYVPLCMLLAGALPLSTGKSSYTSPYLCEIWDKGRCQSRLAMIESLSITRGITHLPFDKKGNALGINVQFSVVDLSSIMHMPISDGSLFKGDMTMDEDNILMDYLAVLAGQDMYTQIYPMGKLQITLAKVALGFREFTSPASWASTIHDSLTTGWLRPGSLVEALVRGTDVMR